MGTGPTRVPDESRFGAPRFVALGDQHDYPATTSRRQGEATGNAVGAAASR
jgi:hypothetical protein